MIQTRAQVCNLSLNVPGQRQTLLFKGCNYDVCALVMSLVCHVPQVVHSDDKPVKETILEDSECPLQIFRDWTSDKGLTTLLRFPRRVNVLSHAVIAKVLARAVLADV